MTAFDRYRFFVHRVAPSVVDDAGSVTAEGSGPATGARGHG